MTEFPQYSDGELHHHPPAPTAATVRAHVEKIVTSPGFQQSLRMKDFLCFVIEEVLAGRGERVKEYTVAQEVFQKDETFDPKTSSIVRVEASRLRSKLKQYYECEGQADPIRLEIPKGSYVPVVRMLAAEPRRDAQALPAPPSDCVQRRITAILSADVVGYSRLMGVDEAGTHGALRAHLGELIVPMIAEHNGRVVRLMGDGILVDLASAIDAVECGAAIQEGMALRNAEVPDDRQITFRIGITLGDVIIDGDDIYGECVNVAARLQELAEPGGVYISGTVFEQVDGKVGVNFVDWGNQQIKNIAKLVRVYRAKLLDNSSTAQRRPLFDMQGGKDVPVTGGCLCGEVRYEITKPCIENNFCHCRICQKFSGAPVVAMSTYPVDAIRFTKGEPKYYKSSPFVERGFCANCGSSLTYRPLTPSVTPNWADWIVIHTASLDNPEPNAPAWHLGVESQMPWVDIHHAPTRVRCQDAPDIVEAWAAFNLPVP